MNLLADELKEIAKNPELALIYAKKNCRHCIGKGWITRSFPVNGQSLEREEICQCVYKKLKKEFGQHG